MTLLLSISTRNDMIDFGLIPRMYGQYTPAFIFLRIALDAAVMTYLFLMLYHIHMPLVRAGTAAPASRLQAKRLNTGVHQIPRGLS